MGACVARCAFAILLGMFALIPSFRQKSGNVRGISNEFKPGMTVEQLVAVFPTDFFIASISVPSGHGRAKMLQGTSFHPRNTLFISPT
jgi:hypothetical protein